MYQFIWKNEYPKDLEEFILTQVYSECQDLLACGLSDPSHLIFHTVFLEEDYEGKAVSIYGKEGDTGIFYCEYIPEIRWVTYDKLSDTEKTNK